jgi:hypothetical protein
MTPGYFFQEDGHGFCGYYRQNQTVQIAVLWAYRAKGVSIFPDNLHPHFRPDTLGSPATSGVINPAKPGLILKHQSELPPQLLLPQCLLFNYFRQFF